ncbi:hypothetical protein F5888DRAFT_1738865 [Russula emetica]|nr:hypothetical protein F5888DRAFT_1738865 [Russula emetica]
MFPRSSFPPSLPRSCLTFLLSTLFLSFPPARTTLYSTGRRRAAVVRPIFIFNYLVYRTVYFFPSLPLRLVQDDTRTISSLRLHRYIFIPYNLGLR